MKIIDGEEVLERYPERRSLKMAVEQARPVRISEQIEYIRDQMCEHYCKMPYQYSKQEWSDMLEEGVNLPCDNCPLNML